MRDFKLDMQVYNYKNEKCEIWGKFSELKRKQLCFIQNLSMIHDYEDDKHKFGWKYSDEIVASEIDTENATSSDIEEIIKECFDYYDVKYDFVKVELL